MLFISMLLFFGASSAYSQTTPVRSHAISHSTLLQPNVPDSLTIIGLRVEFQKDNNRLTTGDGTFDQGNLSYLDNSDVTIDPLPHDLTYFNSHLEFAKNYFETVSGNQIAVSYRMLSDIYRLPQKMETYSPTGETFTNEKVAKLVRDTWAVVEDEGGFETSRLDPQKTVFVIFHAGVGRDIELVGTTLDKTPQDIPSLFLGQDRLGELLNEPNFEGFQINDGSFFVTNSIILPRTLSRRGEDISGEEFVLQLSLNGLLSASVGSYLGLPDLFNTRTGSSGIGRFGLMDGESFFSYRGLFPPEPSAWEKTFLGWQSPFTITKNTGNISLASAALHQNNSIAKYPLSNHEYFLIENRHRSPNGNGVTLTITQPDGSRRTQQFDNGDEAFVNQTDNFEETLSPGVVTDVSNFDWSLPGGLDLGPDETAGTSDDRSLNGGILIWHIDEAVIRTNLNSQTVNANPRRRGVDLEEADGAQDIGRAANSNFTSQARGSAFDFWWNGNNASVITLEEDTLSFYENRFGPNTHPSNASNSGALSFFELFDFSDNLPVANFRIRPVINGNIQPIDLAADTLPDQTAFTTDNEDYFSSYPLSLSLYNSQSDSFLIIPTQRSAYALSLQNNERSIFDFQSGLTQQPYIANSLILGAAPHTQQIDLTAWLWDGSSWNTIWSVQAQANSAFISSLNNQHLLLDFTDQRINISDGSFLSPLSAAQQQSNILNGQFSRLFNGELRLSSINEPYTAPPSERLYTGSLLITENQPGFFLLTDRSLQLFDPQRFPEVKAVVQNTPLEWPAITDINSDGKTDFTYVNQATGSIESRNINGAMLSYFPIRPPRGSSFIGTPLIAETNNDKGPIIFIATQDSLSINMRAYTAKGKQIKGFPLFVGTVANPKHQPIHPILIGNTLFAVSHQGELKAWELNDISNVLWGSRYGNNTFNKVSGQQNFGSQPTPADKGQILVKKETYNWPNPAEDYTTIRFQTAEPGKITLKIITTGGSVVYEEQYLSNGTTPEEHRISTQNWSSGLYFGMITAHVNGQKDQKMIKMVIIH